METSLNQEDTPASFGNKIWSQNKDETSALIHAASQVFNVSLEKYKRRKTTRSNVSKEVTKIIMQNDILAFLKEVKTHGEPFHDKTVAI